MECLHSGGIEMILHTYFYLKAIQSSVQLYQDCACLDVFPIIPLSLKSRSVVTEPVFSGFSSAYLFRMFGVQRFFANQIG